MEVLIMKKVLAIVLMLALVLSISAVAFAAPSPSSSGNKSAEPEVYAPAPAPAKEDEEEVLASIELPEDVAVDSDVEVAAMADSPAEVKELAADVVSDLEDAGYTVISGFSVWSESGDVTSCEVTVQAEDVPEGAEIFVNGKKIVVTLVDGVYKFEVELPAVITIVKK
jgi:hypothetical protein